MLQADWIAWSIAQCVGQALQHAGYHGPCGVDGFLCREDGRCSSSSAFVIWLDLKSVASAMEVPTAACQRCESAADDDPTGGACG